LKPKNFFAELKRRKVYRVAAAYAVASWLLIQIATQVFPFFDVPSWAVRLVVLLLCLGFPLAVILAWIFDITPQGIRRTDDLGDESKKSAAEIRAPEKSIAVLPFENLSDDKENEYFAAGVHDDILSSLAKIADLKVISRTSVQQFKSGTRNLREIGAALGVAHILEGTARRVGNRVRVNAQLIDARTDIHIWSETFDREVTDLFTLQSELAQRITQSLRANLSPREKTSLQAHPTRDLVAYELFLRARGLFHWAGSGYSHDKGAEALRVIREAVTRDPMFALAYALESRLHSELFWFGYDHSQSRLEKAKAAAETALRLQPDLGEAHLANAFYYYYGFRRYDIARTHVAAAVRAIPNSADVLVAAGAIARREGQWDAAVSSFEKARERDPRNLSVLWNLFETYLALHRYREAEQAIADALPLSSEAHFFTLARGSLGLFDKGETSPLRSALRAVPSSFDPGGAVSLIALRLLLMDRDFDEAERVLTACAHEKLDDNGLSGIAGALDGYTVPKSWYAGLIARGRGDEAMARNEFEKARRVVRNDLIESADDAKSMAMLAMIEAALGNKQEALDQAQRAEQLLPIAKDSFDGPIIATVAAAVSAQVGQHDAAIKRLESLVGIPNGPTSGTLRVEPEWDSLRTDPRFKSMLGSN
jgi:TolB-like protein/thioredoxin-like negative regulator of GroEL